MDCTYIYAEFKVRGVTWRARAFNDDGEPMLDGIEVTPGWLYARVGRDVWVTPEHWGIEPVLAEEAIRDAVAQPQGGA